MSDTKELQKIKGVGEVLAARLAEAGFDTAEKLAAAGEKKLAKIKGLNPRLIPSILAQAAELHTPVEGKESKAERMRAVTAELRGRLQALAVEAKERFAEELQGKVGKKLEKEFSRVLDALERAEAALETKVKRASKGIAKAEKRISPLNGEGVDRMVKVLKKTRKSLKKATA